RAHAVARAGLVAVGPRGRGRPARPGRVRDADLPARRPADQRQAHGHGPHRRDLDRGGHRGVGGAQHRADAAQLPRARRAVPRPVRRRRPAAARARRAQGHRVPRAAAHLPAAHAVRGLHRPGHALHVPLPHAVARGPGDDGPVRGRRARAAGGHGARPGARCGPRLGPRLGPRRGRTRGAPLNLWHARGVTPTLPTRTTHVLLDLDGTLTDSAPGIVASLRTGFADAGFAVPSDEVLRTFVGPPLGASMARVGLAGADAEAAIAAYRRDFEVRGMFDNSVFPGVTDALTELREAGVTLLVATAKPENYARQIVEHFGLDAYLARGLDGVHGADPEAVHETAGKEVVVERALATAVALGADSSQVV